MARRLHLGLGLLLALGLSSVTPLSRPALAQPMMGGMPDPSQMSGIPRPDPNVPAGTITVRVIRGSFQNNLGDVEVELAGLDGDATRRRAKTNAMGRAVFSDLPRGKRYEARASVDGEALATQPIPMPADAGVAVMLVFQKSAAEQQAELGTPDGKARVDKAVPAGTLLLRAVDESGKPLAGLVASLHHADRETEKVEQLPDQTTNAKGEASWTGLRSGAGDGYMAAVVRAGSQQRSQPFRLTPETGSLVVLTAREVSRDASQLTLGNGSHIIFDVSDEAVQVIENLVLKNPLPQAVDPGPGGLRIPLAERALSAQVISEGQQDPRLSIDVSQADQPPALVWKGPIPAGDTPMRAAFLLKHDGTARFRQSLAQNAEALMIVVSKLPGITASGADLDSQERKIEGKEWILLRAKEGKPPTAGSVVEFQISGLPHDGPIYRGLAGLLAVIIAIILGALSIRGPSAEVRDPRRERRDHLNQRREALLQELLRAERDPAKARPRDAILAELTPIYQELDVLEDSAA